MDFNKFIGLARGADKSAVGAMNRPLRARGDILIQLLKSIIPAWRDGVFRCGMFLMHQFADVVLKRCKKCCKMQHAILDAGCLLMLYQNVAKNVAKCNIDFWTPVACCCDDSVFPR
jgi:hypothetical protein